MNQAQKIANHIARSIMQAIEAGYVVDIIITDGALIDVRVGLGGDQGANVTRFNTTDKSTSRDFQEEVRIKTDSRIEVTPR